MTATREDFVRAATAAYRVRLEALTGALGVPAADPQAAGERAAAVTAAGIAWNDAVGPFLDTDGVRSMLGGPSRQAVADRVQHRRLLALRTAEGGRRARLLYPLWQFDGQTLATLPRVLAAAGYDPTERTHGWHVASWLSTPDPVLGGRRPRDLLATGQADGVLAAAADVRYELGVDELAAGHAGAQRGR